MPRKKIGRDAYPLSLKKCIDWIEICGRCELKYHLDGIFSYLFCKGFVPSSEFMYPIGRMEPVSPGGSICDGEQAAEGVNSIVYLRWEKAGI